jgi:hypothetical protein
MKIRFSQKNRRMQIIGFKILFGHLQLPVKNGILRVLLVALFNYDETRMRGWMGYDGCQRKQDS